MKQSRNNKILAKGYIPFPEGPRFIPSECYFTQDSLQWIVSTFSIQERELSGPLFSLKWDLHKQELVYDPLVLGHTLRSEHARNLNFSPDGKMAILADHGADVAPFPGGISKLFIKEGNTWRVSDLLPDRLFHFDVAISDNVLKGEYLVFMSNLNKFDNIVLKISKVGEVTPLPNAWPRDISFSDIITGLFVDVDGDGVDELVLGGRFNSKGDRILKWNGHSFVATTHVIPEKVNGPLWETVQLISGDMNKNGSVDIITLNHDQKIQQGALEVYLNDGAGNFARMDMDQALTDLPKIKNRWLHRVQTIDFGSGFPSLAFTVRKADFATKNTHHPVLFALNNNGKELEYGGYDLFADEEFILASYVADFNQDGKPELLLIRFDGHWDLATINPFED